MRWAYAIESPRGESNPTTPSGLVVVVGRPTVVIEQIAHLMTVKSVFDPPAIGPFVVRDEQFVGMRLVGIRFPVLIPDLFLSDGFPVEEGFLPRRFGVERVGCGVLLHHIYYIAPLLLKLY